MWIPVFGFAFQSNPNYFFRIFKRILCHLVLPFPRPAFSSFFYVYLLDYGPTNLHYTESYFYYSYIPLRLCRDKARYSYQTRIVYFCIYSTRLHLVAFSQSHFILPARGRPTEALLAISHM